MKRMTFDDLSPALRKAIRETGSATADIDALAMLRAGESEEIVLESMRLRRDPISADKLK